jgi:hypothetical protein
MRQFPGYMRKKSRRRVSRRSASQGLVLAEMLRAPIDPATAGIHLLLDRLMANLRRLGYRLVVEWRPSHKSTPLRDIYMGRRTSPRTS